MSADMTPPHPRPSATSSFTPLARDAMTPRVVPAPREVTTPRELVGTFASLRIRNFRIFAMSQVISNSGAWTQRVAQDWLVLTLTGSPAAVGVTTALQFAPAIGLSMVGGLAADRFDKRRLLLITQTSMAISSAVLALLCFTGAAQFWHVLVLAAVTGVANAFDNPTRQAFVHEMVGPRHVSNAVSINSAVFQLGALIGPAVSAVLIAAVGIGFAFATNAVSFAGVLVALAVMDASLLYRAPVTPRERGRLVGAIREIRRRPELRWPIILAGVCGFVTANFPVVLVAFVQELSFDAAGYGLLTCSLAVGSLIGALVAARRPHTRLRHLVTLAMAIAVALLVVAATPGIVTLCLALVVTGAIAMPFGITANTSTQLAAGDSMRGRVMGVYVLAVLGAAGIGGPVIGGLVELVGARGGLVINAAMIAAVTGYAILRLARSSGTGVAELVSVWKRRAPNFGLLRVVRAAFPAR